MNMQVGSCFGLSTQDRECQEEIPSNMSVAGAEDEEGVLYPQDSAYSGLVEVYRLSPSASHRRPQARRISDDHKRTILQLSASASDVEESMLRGIVQIDPRVATQFRLKDTAAGDFVMRLLYDDFHEPIHPSTFVILSYTWHNPSWKPHACLGASFPRSSADALPLTPAMWSAFLSQRRDTSEGFWCDQLCITQSSSDEKMAAIGSMDLLYKNARTVVVALEDISITEAEMDALVVAVMDDVVMYSENIDSQPDKPEEFNSNRHERAEQHRTVMASAFAKIVKARWFDRAWCFHEFLLGKYYVFLVPVDAKSGNAEVTIIKIRATILEKMSNAFVELNAKNTRVLGTSLFSSLDVSETHAKLLYRFVRRLTSLSIAETFGVVRGSKDNSYMNMFLEVFSRGSFELADKVSILLNVMDSGIYYVGSNQISEEDCLHLIVSISLAAGDPTALTTNGASVMSNAGKQENQWLRLPTLEDLWGPPGFTRLPKFSANLNITEFGLKLNMKFICNGNCVYPADYKYLSIARLLFDHRAMCEESLLGPIMIWDLVFDEECYRVTRLAAIHALGCALQLGAEWMCQVHVKLHAKLPCAPAFPDVQLKQQFEDAVKFALSMEIEEDIGRDMREVWEEDLAVDGREDPILLVDAQNWLKDAVDTAAEDENDKVVQGNEECEDGELSLEANKCYWYLLRFADVLITKGLAINYNKADRPAALKETHFAVQILQTDGGPFVLFMPEPGQYQNSALRLCIPEALADEEYQNISRLWILKERVSMGTGFELVSKTRLIGGAAAPQGEDWRDVLITR